MERKVPPVNGRGRRETRQPVGGSPRQAKPPLGEFSAIVGVPAPDAAGTIEHRRLKTHVMTKIGIGQAAFRVGEPEHNRAIIHTLLEQADALAVDVLVLPELANSGYSLAGPEEAEQACEAVPGGPASQLLAQWSAGGRLVVAGLGEKADGRYYSAAGVFADGRHRLTYRKIHLFNRESALFSPGDQPPPVFEHAGGRYGVLVCFDWAFPEVFRVLALQGAQVVLHPANLVLPYCQAAMVTRSIENRIFTAMANRTGPDRDLHFRGESQITAPDGRVVARAAGDFAGILVAEVDLREADDKMITPFNHVLKDRRPELYGGGV